MAEKLGRFDIAEQLYRQYAALPNTRDGKIVLALFLGRHGHVKEALDLCEPLWANPRNVETVAATCIEVVTSSNDPPDPVQVDRVAGWLEQAIKQKNDSTLPAGCIWLTAVNGRGATMRQRHFTQSVIKRALATR